MILGVACTCVCVCVCERERERVFVFIYFCLLNVNNFFSLLTFFLLNNYFIDSHQSTKRMEGLESSLFPQPEQRRGTLEMGNGLTQFTKAVQ